MKKLLICIFLIGLFAIGYSPPPDVGAKQITAKTEFAHAVYQVAPVLNVVNAIDIVALPVPDIPVQIYWMTQISEFAVLSANFELSGHKMYSSNDILNTNEKPFGINQLYIPDKSLNSGQLAIRDKL